MFNSRMGEKIWLSWTRNRGQFLDGTRNELNTDRNRQKGLKKAGYQTLKLIFLLIFVSRSFFFIQYMRLQNNFWEFVFFSKKCSSAIWKNSSKIEGRGLQRQPLI